MNEALPLLVILIGAIVSIPLLGRINEPFRAVWLHVSLSLGLVGGGTIWLMAVAS